MSDFPHKCPRCSSSAYVGLNQIECTNKTCNHYLPGSQVSNPDAGMLYRDFCMGCKQVAEFDRERGGKYYVADCPHCGCLNSWHSGEGDEEDVTNVWFDIDEEAKTDPSAGKIIGPQDLSEAIKLLEKGVGKDWYQRLRALRSTIKSIED